MGYEPNKNKIYLFNDFGDVFTFNLSNGIISRTSDRFQNFESALEFGMSNVITHNHLMYCTILPGPSFGEDGGIYTFNINPQSAEVIQLITRDIDFGAPSIKKIIYTIYITYKTSASEATNVKIIGAKNGSEVYDITFTEKEGWDGGFSGNTLSAPSRNAFVKVAIKPSSSITDLYSLQLKIYSEDGTTVPSTFEIDDISITYRFKGVR